MNENRPYIEVSIDYVAVLKGCGYPTDSMSPPELVQAYHELVANHPVTMDYKYSPHKRLVGICPFSNIRDGTFFYFDNHSFMKQGDVAIPLDIKCNPVAPGDVFDPSVCVGVFSLE